MGDRAGLVTLLFTDLVAGQILTSELVTHLVGSRGGFSFHPMQKATDRKAGEV